MDKRTKFSYKQKISTVRSIISGRESSLSASRKNNCRENTIVRWLRQYQRHGVSGLKLRNGNYEGRFKLQVVRYMLTKGLSLMETAVHFKIPNECVVGNWRKKYEKEGSAGLLKNARGRKKTVMSKRPKKQRTGSSDTRDEKLAALQKEVEYLRAENAFLKKLEALVQQEKTAEAQSGRQKPSRN